LIEVKRNSNSLRKLTGNRETTAFGKREGEKYGEGGVMIKKIKKVA